MAPKKKSKKSKGHKGSGGIIDGISISEMSREQLEAFVSRIQLELEREREERNFFQLESNKLRTFWEITRQNIEENRALLSNKDRQLEKAEEQHREEIKVGQQKVKLLMYEQHTELSHEKLKNMDTLKHVEAEFSERELNLLNEKRKIICEKLEDEKLHLLQIRSQVMDNNEKISKIRSVYENDCRILELKYQRCTEQFREELEFKNEIEMNEIEERKNSYIKLLVNNHDEMYKGIVHFYTEITAKNLALISILKERLIKMKEEKYKMLVEMQFLRKQNQEFVSPLQIARHKITELQHKVDISERYQGRIRILEKQYIHLKKKFDNLQYSHDILTESYEHLKSEKDKERRNMNKEFLEFQQEITYQNVVLEQKVAQLKNIIEQKEAQIIELIIGENHNNTYENIKTVQNTLKEKNEIIA